MAMNRIQFQPGLPLTTFMDCFGSEAQCAQQLAALRWPDGFRCPRCSCPERYPVSHEGRTLYQYKSCRHQTSLTAGTLLDSTKLPLRTWFLAIYLISQAKTGLSALALARGNEKGRVERSIGYIREAFFAAREFADLDDLNAQARAWCEGQASDRPWPEDRRQSVREAFERVRASLLAWPEHEFVLGKRVAVQVGKTPYVRFDLNDYSVPHAHVRRTLWVPADERRVRVFDGTLELADHPRSWDSGAQIEDARHIEALVQAKAAARAHRACDRLAQAAPASAQLLQRAAERGHNLGTITAALMRLLQRYGSAALQTAIGEALQRDVPHPSASEPPLRRCDHTLRPGLWR